MNVRPIPRPVRIAVISKGGGRRREQKVSSAQSGNSFTLTPAASARPGENTDGLNFLSFCFFRERRIEMNRLTVRLRKHLAMGSLVRIFSILCGVVLVHTLAIGQEIIPATVDVNPKSIKLNSKGTYITVYIEFPSGTHDPADIDASTVTLQVIDPVTSIRLHVAPGSPTLLGDGNKNGILDLMVKFDRASVQANFSSAGSATFRVEGELLDGTRFRGDDNSVQTLY
jgi:hypothetical protein